MAAARPRRRQPLLARRTVWLTPGEPAARTRLNQLRSADPELRHGPLDMDRLARRVLLLTSDERVTGDRRAELIRLASSPEARNVTSLAGLSALYLVDRGVFDDRFRVTDTRGRPRGINWTGSPIPAGLDPSTTAVMVRRDGGSTVGDVRPALWASGPGRPTPISSPPRARTGFWYGAARDSRAMCRSRCSTS
ncbi:hypothetical protein SAZ11_00480 [Streptomyces sp. FXJ1.4098]|nr:hypothetical protein [Streptomyces sp. FXJ1.4098]